MKETYEIPVMEIILLEGSGIITADSPEYPGDEHDL